MKPSVKPVAHPRVECLPAMPWNECPRSRGIAALLPWNTHIIHSSIIVNAAAMFGPTVAIKSAEDAIRLIESLAMPVPPVEIEGRVH